MTTTNVIPLSTEPHGSVCRVAPSEARWIRLSEIEAAEVARDWHCGPNALRSQINRLDHKLRDTLEQHVRVQQQHRERDFEVFHPKFPHALYWVLLGLAALLETPLNNSALGLLMMDDTETWLVALSLASLSVLGASFVGCKLRQSPWQIAALRDWLFVAVLLTVALAAMFALAGLRMEDLALRTRDAGLPVSDAASATFLSVQLLFFVVGAFFSYSMHPADAALEQLLKQQQRLRSRADALLQQRAGLAARHDRALGLADAAIRKLRAECMTRIAEYREFNMASRGSPAPLWLRARLDESVFTPLDLGTALDPTPASFDELVRNCERSDRA